MRFLSNQTAVKTHASRITGESASLRSTGNPGIMYGTMEL